MSRARGALRALVAFSLLLSGLLPAFAAVDVPPGNRFKQQPAIDMDLLYWSRHFRNMPGEGDLPVKDFLAAVAPKYAVIEVGDSNSYNHPNQGTLDRLKAAGVTLFRTDLQGTITCTSDGKALTFQTGKTASSDVFTKKDDD